MLRLVSFLDTFSLSIELNDWYQYYRTRFSFSQKVLEQTLKRRMAQHFDVKNNQGFKEYFSFNKTFKWILLHYGTLIYNLLTSKIYNKKNQEKYHLIIHSVAEQAQSK